ncbi:MAG: glycosyltransferase [Firmicutes bacterium]|nr:glycosyltransferase [Bacillota bacterium]
MRILMVSGTNMAVSGGDTIHTLELAGALATAGARVTLVARGKGRVRTRRGMRVVTLPAVRFKGLDMALRPVTVWLAVFFLAVGRRYQAAYVRDSIYELPAVILLRLLGVAVLLEVNTAADEDLRAGGGAAWKASLLGWAQRQSCYWAGLVLPVTDTLAHRLRAQGVPDSRIVVVPNGANPGLYRPGDRGEALAALGLDPFRRYFCFAGNLAAWQGGALIIEAFSRLVRRRPDAVLLVVGDGQERRLLEELAAGAAPSGGIIFTGRVPYRRAPLYIKACVAGVGGGWHGGNPALQKRLMRTGSSALKVFSYLACGVPVIIPDIPGLAGVVRRVGCGLVAPPGTAAGLAAAMQAVLDYPGRWMEAGCRGRDYIEREASWQHRARRVLALAAGLGRGAGDGRR